VSECQVSSMGNARGSVVEVVVVVVVQWAAYAVALSKSFFSGGISYPYRLVCAC
jgi:hypothetical protein